jgi:hypothetical protein
MQMIPKYSAKEVLEKYRRELFVEKRTRILLIVYLLFWIVCTSLLYLKTGDIVIFFLFLVTTHFLTKLIRQTNHNIRILKIVKYVSEVELGYKKFEDKHPELVDMIEILTGKSQK